MITPVSGCTITDTVASLGIENFVVYGDPKNENEFNSMFKKVVGVDSTNTAILSSNPSDFGVNWSQVEAKKLELQAAEPMRLLRLERDRRIALTDWRFRSDLTPSQAWIDHCQALRDLPSNSPNAALDENGNLINVEWPEMPQ